MPDTIRLAGTCSALRECLKPEIAARIPHHCFKVHDPVNFLPLPETYMAYDYRSAALKSASLGMTRILLRRVNTNWIREFAGDIIVLDDPKTVKCGTYAKKPTARYVRTFRVGEAFPDDL